MRDLRCLCSGSASGCEYSSKKTGCKAMIRLLRSDDDGWYISNHVAEHNHPLSETCMRKWTKPPKSINRKYEKMDETVGESWISYVTLQENALRIPGCARRATEGR
ncbi:uncharacterized protein C2845_PM08G23870 [Panicum miliaceum]|uniref:FAR1 domain-containing protein n=1 Tax=Panicum miliaceum TaxID=4540 RepID=A0A3L6R067_PANMI|nr:uncharacterized protein C2845_PM08G23870 [Panicum miliaceum]